MNKQKNLLICCRFDSFIKASYSIRNCFEKNDYNIEYLLLNDKGVVDKKHLSDIGFEGSYDTGGLNKLFSVEYVSRFDAVMLSLKGPEIYKVISTLENVYPKTVPRPIFFGGYCGIVYEKFSMGMLARQGLDVFYVNSKHDHDLFCRLLKEYGVADHENIKLTGLPLLDLSYEKKLSFRKNKIENVLFAGQPTVPESLSERTSIVYSLIKYCNKFPDRKVYFKPRHKPNQDSVHKTLFHYQRIFEKLSKKISIPDNLIITYEPILNLLESTDLCLTVSSTAAFEAANKGVLVGFLMDFGIREDYGTTYFAASGCATTFSDLLEDRAIEPDMSWWNERYLADGKNSGRVFEAVDSLVELVRNKQTSLPFRYNHLKAIGRSYDDFQNSEISLEYRSVFRNWLLKIYYYLKIKGVVE